ncbi:MAG: hypothetical protein WA857_08130 [Candidatus Acidiferrum sp.]
MNCKLQWIARRATLFAAAQIALLAAAGSVVAQMAPAQTADEIVAKVLDARGGVEKSKAIQTERITGILYFNPEMYGPFLAEFKRPGKMHNEVTLQNKTVVRTFNGKDMGWVLNPFAGKSVPEPMSADDIKDAANESDIDGPLVDAKAKGNLIELAGTEKVEGHDAYILKVTRKDGSASSYSFDTQTYLLTKWSGKDMVNGDSVIHETYFHDYRDVGGLKFAFEVVSRTPGVEESQRIAVSKIELDPPIDDSHFEKPQVAAAPSGTAPQSSPPGNR